MQDKINLEVLKNMKPADKAKAFDKIVDAYQGDNAEQQVTNILNWCSDWFSE